jgi:hypothetical protein
MAGRHLATVPAAVLALLCVGGCAVAANEGLGVLDGEWRGPGLSLFIDAARSQARVDEKKPFQWDPFNIRDVSGPMVVFSVGDRLFIGYVDGDSMRLTRRGHGGDWTLRRRAAE